VPITFVNKIPFSKEAMEQEYVDIDVFPEVSSAKTYYSAGGFYLAMAMHLQNVEQVHGNKVVSFNVGVPKIASGKVTIDLSSVSKEDLLQRDQTAQVAAKDNLVKARHLPEQSMQSATFHDPRLSQKNLLKMFKGVFGTKATLLKLYVSEGGANDWAVVNNDLGLPIKKQVTHYMMVVFRNADGRCYYNQSATVVQDHEGGGKYSKPIAEYTADNDAQIACENVPK
jgi:hypothetical protein